VLVTRSGEHIEFNSLLVRLPPAVTKALGVFNQLIIGAFAMFMVIYGYNYSMMFTFEKTPAAGINLLWLNLALPINGVFILVYASWNILRTIARGSAQAGSS
jgi:TRAP-type C4-dicarboxylate transport system permease small subunit